MFANAPGARRKTTVLSPKRPRLKNNDGRLPSVKSGLALLAVALCLMAFARADEPLPTWDDDSAKAWWAQNPSPDKWRPAVVQLRAQLEIKYKSDGASAFSDPNFQAWLEHLGWIQLGLDCPDILADPNNLTAFITLGNDPAVSHLFIQKLDPANSKRGALRVLLSLAKANLDDLNAYPALGVAFSLVFDKPFPSDWPHHQVDPHAVPIGDLDAVKRFNFYVQSDRDKKLELDLTQQTFENLKFLVDSEVSLSELAYAQANPQRIPYSQFQDAFFSIRYDYSRIKPPNFTYNWFYPTYKLADIEKNGGICIDQAYYATILGKGRGIPTLYFTGVGTGGGHAWFGYLSISGRWELDCGRYADQNYPKGYALDPQTWRIIDDTQLTNFFKNGVSDSNYAAAITGLAWARLHQGDPSSRQILDDTRSVMPELAQTWKIEAGVLPRTGASDDDQIKFYRDWITQFQSFAEMKFFGQEHLLTLLKKTNDPEADSVEQDIVLQNRSQDFDLGIVGAADVLSEKIQSGDWDGAKLQFQQTIRDFGGQGGVTLYDHVISYYIGSCLVAGRASQADDGIRFVEDRMPIDPTTQLGIDFAKLKAQVKAAQGDGSSAAASP